MPGFSNSAGEYDIRRCTHGEFCFRLSLQYRYEHYDPRIVA